LLNTFAGDSYLTADVMEGSRLYENIFVSGGALLADDTILRTIEIGKEVFCLLKKLGLSFKRCLVIAGNLFAILVNSKGRNRSAPIRAQCQNFTSYVQGV